MTFNWIYYHYNQLLFVLLLFFFFFLLPWEYSEQNRHLRLSAYCAYSIENYLTPSLGGGDSSVFYSFSLRSSDWDHSICVWYFQVSFCPLFINSLPPLLSSILFTSMFYVTRSGSQNLFSYIYSRYTESNCSTSNKTTKSFDTTTTETLLQNILLIVSYLTLV